MPYSINALDLIEIQVIGRHDGQRTRSVFHYSPINLPAPVPNGQAELLALLGNWGLTMYADLLDVTAAAWTCELLQVQRISPIRMRAIQKTPVQLGVAAVGAVNGLGEPSGCASRVSLATLVAGQKYQGGKWLPAVPVSFVANSMLTVPAFNALQHTANSMLDNQDGQPGNTYSPVIAHRLLGPLIGYEPVNVSDIIDQAIAKPEVRYMRTREVGKGE